MIDTRRFPVIDIERGGSIEGEIEGVRGYRRGDPMKLIAWKKAAQAVETGAELVSRDTSVSTLTSHASSGVCGR